MAMLEMTFQSDVLGFEQQLCVLLPEPEVILPDAKELCAGRNGALTVPTEEYAVLYLLNGASGNHLDWVRRTMVTHYLEQSKKRLAIVMPSGLTSFYTDMKRGWKYFTYVAEEVPLIARTYLPLSGKRENTYIAGLSMGGGGAVKTALRYPEKFAGAASFSGVVDNVARVHRAMESQPEMMPNFRNIFGDDIEEVRGTKDDTLALLDQCDPKTAPKLYISCGMDDIFVKDARTFRDKAVKNGFDIDYYEEDGVGHEWPFWDREIKKWIDRIPDPV